MESIFSKIIAGDIPCYKIAEDKNHLAFLDINPLGKGHTLVIPKQEIDYIFDIEDKELANLFVFAKRVSKAIKSTIACEKIALSVVGLEVPHAHIHLIPINTVSDMNFAKAKMKLSKEDFSQIATQISNNFV